MTYRTLSAPCQAVYEMKKSQFLAFAYPIATKDDVMLHVNHLKSTYGDARHHCVAYILGDPCNTTHAGFDDDGEPNGTAGKPILSVLRHKGIGNVLVVIVRYFGGIKLGVGGLTRAYASATQQVVDAMALVVFVPKSKLTITTTFANEAQVRYLVGRIGGEILSTEYAQTVVITAQIDNKKLDELNESLRMYGRMTNL